MHLDSMAKTYRPDLVSFGTLFRLDELVKLDRVTRREIRRKRAEQQLATHVHPFCLA